jgi:hypothetical protein
MSLEATLKAVMAGLDPAIHVLIVATTEDVHARHEAEHDG